MITAFGMRAEAYAAGLSELDVIVTDMTGIGAAYFEAVRWREEGRSFYGMVLYEEPRAQATLGYAAAVLEQTTGLDARRTALDNLGYGRLGLGTQKAEELWTPAPEQTRVMNEFLSLSNGVLVRSFAEAARLNALVQRPHAVEPALVEPLVPDVAPRPGRQPGVVVWAPNALAGYVAWYAFALAEFFGEVTCVAAGGSVPADLPARFITPHDPQLAEILAAAQCVLCPDPDDPGAAVAFARRGFGVAAPLQSGAHEYLRDVVSFGLTATREIEMAVKIAIAKPASVRAIPHPRRAPLVPASPRPTAELPLVSIMVLTYNRPDDLERCLTDVSRQTYANLEIVVNNDAGVNVDHIVARFPRVRVVNQPQNLGLLRTIVELFEIARGEYIMTLSDDDTLYPDHIERLMGAMLRSGACIAHGNTLIRYQRRNDDGTQAVAGYNATIFNNSATPTEALVSTNIAGHSLLIRRAVIDAIGPYSIETALSDQEFQMRSAQHYVFAWVDEFTAEWRVRGAGSFSMQTDREAEQRKVYEELHPVPDRPLVGEYRRATLERLAERKGTLFPPTILVQEPPPAGDAS